MRIFVAKLTSKLLSLNKRETVRLPHSNLIWIWEDARIAEYPVLRLLLGESQSLKCVSNDNEEEGRVNGIRSDLMDVGNQFLGIGLRLEIHAHCVEIASSEPNGFDVQDDVVVANIVGVIARHLKLAILPGIVGVITDTHDYEQSNRTYGHYWPLTHELMASK